MLGSATTGEEHICVLEGLWYCKCSRFAHVRTKVCRTFLDGEYDYTAYHRDLDTAQDAQRHCTDEWTGVSEVLLESVDRQQGKIGFVFGIAQEIDVDQLPYLKVLRGDVLDYLGEVVGYVSAFGYELRGGQGALKV